PITEEQRSERRARALPLRVPPDHEVCAVRGLDLEPRGGALACLINAVLALARAALQPGRHRGRVQGHAIFHGVHKLYPGRWQEALRQITAAVGVGCPAQVDSAEIQEVEAVEHRALARAAAVLHGAEGRLAA